MTIITIKDNHFLIRSEREDGGEQALYAFAVDEHGEILDPYPVAGGVGYTYRSLQADLEAEFIGDAEVDEVEYDDDEDDEFASL